MKRFFFPLLLLTVGLLAAAPATVQVKEASLYAKPTPTSKFLGRVPLGTVLTIVSEKDGWAQVRAEEKGLTGWLRVQAYTTKAPSLKSTADTGSGVSATEVSLAGRGFTEEVEAEYKKKNPGLDFEILDRMEALGIPEPELTEFLAQGGVEPREVR